VRGPVSVRASSTFADSVAFKISERLPTSHTQQST
jgi:hypothetical protein